VAYLILPLFAFANAGVSFDGMTWGQLGDPVTIGILAGLFIGKQLGIFIPFALAVKSGLCRMPEGVGYLQVYGMAILCGIGFTMSLFIGELAFGQPELQTSVRVGVMVGSLLSALAGYAVLRFQPERT